MKELINIVGPCSAMSSEQVLACAEQAKKRNIQIFRASGWKPRSEHGWDGLKEESLPILAEVAAMGLTPATEVLTLDDAKLVIETIDKVSNHQGLVLWGGSRNQSHPFKEGLARLTSEVPWLTAGFKNQMWKAEKHFRGIATHIVEGAGAGSDRLFMCHRGFHNENFEKGQYRNIPDHAMAMRVRAEATKLNLEVPIEMLIDPSHIGGCPENVLEVIKQAMTHSYAGIMVEVQDNPAASATDADQHLDWNQWDQDIVPLLARWNALRNSRADLQAA